MPTWQAFLKEHWGDFQLFHRLLQRRRLQIYRALMHCHALGRLASLKDVSNLARKFHYWPRVRVSTSRAFKSIVTSSSIFRASCSRPTSPRVIGPRYSCFRSHRRDRGRSQMDMRSKVKHRTDIPAKTQSLSSMMHLLVGRQNFSSIRNKFHYGGQVGDTTHRKTSRGGRTSA